MDIFWSFFTMPIGITICFGPAVLVWWLTQKDGPASDKKTDQH